MMIDQLAPATAFRHIELMLQSEFELLPEYSMSFPTGPREGFRWRTKRGGDWFVATTGKIIDDRRSVHWARVKILDSQATTTADEMPVWKL